MKITVLGSGTSTGVPEVGCTCEVCMSEDPKDKRLRTSILVEEGDKRILIDCGPDFRLQMLHRKYAALDAVLITHKHYDHVGGLDDLRPFCRFGEIPVYADEHTVADLCRRLPYCFVDKRYPGIPALSLLRINPEKPFYVGDLKIIPINVMHGRLPILGYRIGNMAFITDMLNMEDKEYDKLQGLDCLIMNALRTELHPTHQNLEQALNNARKIGAKETYFIHMSHGIGLHREVEKLLPPTVHFTYDGEVIDCRPYTNKPEII